MNPDLKTPVKLPTFNWDAILKRSALLMVIVTCIALLSRARTLLALAELFDVGVILVLLGLGTYALIARSVSKPAPPSDTTPQ